MGKKKPKTENSSTCRYSGLLSSGTSEPGERSAADSSPVSAGSDSGMLAFGTLFCDSSAIFKSAIRRNVLNAGIVFRGDQLGPFRLLPGN